MSRGVAASGGKSDRTRRRILEVACDQFGQVGYHEATLRDIGQDASADPALISRYFDGKAGLFAHAVTFALRSALTSRRPIAAFDRFTRLLMASAFAPPAVKARLETCLRAVLPDTGAPQSEPPSSRARPDGAGTCRLAIALLRILRPDDGGEDIARSLHARAGGKVRDGRTAADGEGVFHMSPHSVRRTSIQRD